MHVVKTVQHIGGYRLRIGFADGAVRVVDMEPHLQGRMFAPLRDVTLFRTARVDPDVDTVVWDNGADVAPEFLYEAGREAQGTAA